MGSQASKESETKVFVPETKVDFTSTLLAQLDASTETDYIRKQLADKYLEQKVSERLVELEVETLKKFEDKLNTSLLTDISESNNELSSKGLSEKIDKLNERLCRLKQAQEAKTTDELKNLESSLVNCLLQHNDKPLNCYEEIQKFKKMVLEQ